MLKPYDSTKADNEYKDFYNQTGSGAPPIFIGSKYQKGYGLGNIFASIARSAIPIIKRGVLSLGRTALNTGVQIAKDGLEGKDIKASAKRNFNKAGRQVISKGLNSLVSSVGNTNQPNKTRKRKRKSSNTPQDLKAKRPRYSKLDIFS